MDSFYIDNVKIEKANAMLRYRRVRKIANFFRFIEVCVALILLSWLSARLPIALRISFGYVRGFCVVLLNPRFVFLVGNAIIITLFAKSGQLCGQAPTCSNTGTDLRDHIKNNENNQKVETDSLVLQAPEAGEIVCEDKQTVRAEEYTVRPTYGAIDATVTDAAPASKICRRSQSENLKLQKFEKHRPELRRSETEKCLKVSSPGGKPEEMSQYSDPQDGLSDEEFRRKIESFIEEQQRVRREEK